LGRYPELSLRDARVQAVLTKTGHDTPDKPSSISAVTGVPELPAPTGEVPTFREFAKVWFDRKKRGLSNGKHIKQNWSTLDTYVFPHFGKLPLDEIRQRHIIAAFDPIWREKHETAKRTLGRVKEVLEHVEVNPADFKLKWSCFLGQICGLAKMHLVYVHAAFRVSLWSKYAASGVRLSRAV